MAALYASCDLVGEDLEPNFRAVERRLGIDQNSLIRWWKRRVSAFDGPERDKAASRVALAAQRGADDWGAHLVGSLHKVYHRTEELLNDDTRWKKAGVDEAARATRSVTQTLREVATGLRDLAEIGKGNAPQAGSGGALNTAVRNALKRTTSRRGHDNDSTGE